MNVFFKLLFSLLNLSRFLLNIVEIGFQFLPNLFFLELYLVGLLLLFLFLFQLRNNALKVFDSFD